MDDGRITLDKAATLGCGCKSTLLKRIRDGHLPAEKVSGRWMVSKRDVETMAERVAAAEHERYMAVVRRVVDGAPPLSGERRMKLAHLLDPLA